jgi:cell division protein FtsN
MFGISNKLVLIQFVVIVTLIGSGYAYFRHSQGVIAALHEDKAKLETAVKIQDETISAQKAQAQKQNFENLKLQQSLFDAENQRRDLEAKLRRKNLEAMARANSVDLEQKINKATEQAFRDIENLTKPKDRPNVDPKPDAAKPDLKPENKPADPQPAPRPPRGRPAGGNN